MSKRLTYNFVKSEFEKEGYTILTKKYINNKQKLDFICPKGHRCNITRMSWSSGGRCRMCYHNKKDRYDLVKLEFEKEGYTLLSEDYINSNSKLKFKCLNNHNHTIKWKHWNAGHRCRKCYKLSYEYVKSKFEEEDYILISKKYINSLSKLDYVCPIGHIWNISYSSFKSGQRCKICDRIRRQGSGSPTWKDYSKKELRKIKNYRNRVQFLTNINFKKYYTLINPKNLQRGKDYHLDHIFSVTDGLKYSIPVEIISSTINLRLINSKENITKSGRSDMSLEDLYYLYYIFEQEVK